MTSLAMKTPGIDSPEAVGSEDKLGLDGCDDSEDARVVLQDSVEELVPSLAMKTPGVDSSKAVGSEDKLGLDGCGASEDTSVVCSDDVDGPSLG